MDPQLPTRVAPLSESFDIAGQDSFQTFLIEPEDGRLRTQGSMDGMGTWAKITMLNFSMLMLRRCGLFCLISSPILCQNECDSLRRVDEPEKKRRSLVYTHVTHQIVLRLLVSSSSSSSTIYTLDDHTIHLSTSTSPTSGSRLPVLLPAAVLLVYSARLRSISAAKSARAFKLFVVAKCELFFQHLRHLEHLPAVTVLRRLWSLIFSNPVNDSKRRGINHDHSSKDTKRDITDLLETAASDSAVVKHWLVAGQ